MAAVPTLSFWVLGANLLRGGQYFWDDAVDI